ncbi:hypothetical protein BRADI_4g16088v3 [Brachypodium distachyon]|uniref:Uncharacterized protein n=1 Tax=Brachypodium distachyon TaxID=15368 RepID=A0A0Q3PFM0_BRADI|nr:hypothetical protein BRADI_4g16088v3 [Brachypodium distachyon]
MFFFSFLLCILSVLLLQFQLATAAPWLRGLLRRRHARDDLPSPSLPLRGLLCPHGRALHIPLLRSRRATCAATVRPLRACFTPSAAFPFAAACLLCPTAARPCSAPHRPTKLRRSSRASLRRRAACYSPSAARSSAPAVARCSTAAAAPHFAAKRPASPPKSPKPHKFGPR